MGASQTFLKKACEIQVFLKRFLKKMSENSHSHKTLPIVKVLFRYQLKDLTCARDYLLYILIIFAPT